VPRRRYVVFIALIAAGSLLAGTRGVFAQFVGSNTNSGNVFSAKQVFPGDRTTSDWTIRDAMGGGSEVNSDNALSYNDGTFTATGNWSSSFSSTRYLEFDFSAPNAAGLSVSAATFDLRVADSVAGNTFLFYFEVRRISTGAVLGTHGSSGSPVGSVVGQTLTTFSTSIAAEVTTTDIANDLRIRVFGQETGGKPSRTDMATASVTAATYTGTQYEVTYRDAADGSVTTTNWQLATADSTIFTPASTPPTTFDTTKYLKFVFPTSLVPAGATVSSATLTLTYAHHTSGQTSCFYYDVISGGSTIQTLGSSSSPEGCVTGTTNQTFNVSMTAINTATRANDVTIKMYWNSTSNKPDIDLLTLKLNWYLN
jgi:hypothetical protein